MSKKENVMVIVLLATSIIVTNSFIIFLPNENSRFYISGLISTAAIGVALVIAVIVVWRYKRGIKKKEEEKQQVFSQQDADTRSHHYYYDDNKMHLSICLFLLSWFSASIIWTLADNQSAEIVIADALYYMGYASFGYFLYSLYYHFFRNEFEPFILILVAVIILIPVIFIVDTIVSTLRLLSTQTVDVWVVVKNAAYPTLDAVMIFPTVIMFWGARRITRRPKNPMEEEQKLEQEISEKDTSPSDYLVSNGASIYILLLFIAMMLSAAGDTGFAYTSAFDITTVQDYVWMWNILYNSDHLCLAAAVVGYRHLFSFGKINT
ncbi:MAG TPA: hypothetical protein VFS97_00825 [Nitrososphaeraceae archaeon]|nr:hypothetical protein [Nitrososphaeraceae archaeon]